MGERMTCVACGAHTSGVLHAFVEGFPCPSCGLPQGAAAAILDIRRQVADAEVKRRALAAELRATRAEEELRIARYRLEQIAQALARGPYDTDPDALHPDRWRTPAGVPLGDVAGDPEEPAV